MEGIWKMSSDRAASWFSSRRAARSLRQFRLGPPYRAATGTQTSDRREE